MKVRKPIKFFSISQSLRVSILSVIVPPEIKGKILEDYLALIFSKDFRKKQKQYGEIEMMYDSSRGRADFILRVGKEKKIITEIGSGKGGYGIKQIKNSGKTIGGYDYGIVIDRKSDLLELVSDRIIKMSLNLWFAM